MKIDNTPQNSKCKLCGNKDVKLSHIISECSKLAQKECNTRHDWVKNVIHLELCKKLKLDHTTKWYMHKPESILANERYKIFWDVEIQTDHLIPTRKPDLLIINKEKKNLLYNGFCSPSEPLSKKQRSGKGDKYLDLARESCGIRGWA